MKTLLCKQQSTEDRNLLHDTQHRIRVTFDRNVPPRSVHSGVSLRVAKAVLTPGIYRVWAGCANDTVCPQLRADGLSVQGAVDIPPGSSPDGRIEQTVAGQPYLLELSFGVRATEPVRFALHTRLSPPVFTTPLEDETSVLRGWIVVAAISGTVLSGASAALAWPLTRRDTVVPA